MQNLYPGQTAADNVNVNLDTTAASSGCFGINYNLDFEYQWSNADFDKQNEEYGYYSRQERKEKNVSIP